MSRVATLQMVSSADWRQNLQQAAGLLADAAAQGAELALLPENFAVFGADQLVMCGREEQSPHGPIRRFLAEQARIHGLWLVAGSVPILSDRGDRVRAACLVLNAEGEEVARYDKLHLFDVDVDDAQASYRESAQIEPGESVVLVDTPVGRLGLTICYDLRFADLYVELVRRGAELITVPAAFTRITGEAHWQILLRARAIETQCYLLAANQGGVHSATRETYGHSMIIDPWGRILTSLSTGEGVCVAELDRQAQAELRQKMPVAQHRRLLREY